MQSTAAGERNILGVRVCDFTKESLWNAVYERIRDKQGGAIVAINPEKCLLSGRDEEIARFLSSIEFPIADGIGIILASRMKKGCQIRRLTGIDAMEHLIHMASVHAVPIFLFGAAPGVAEKVRARMIARYPGLQIAGLIHGYRLDYDRVAATIKESGARLVFVALGSPQQERFIASYRKTMEDIVFQGVGGSFDVFAGDVRRAPGFIRKIGLEWLYRLLRQPSRIKRQIRLVAFLGKVLISRPT